MHTWWIKEALQIAAGCFPVKALVLCDLPTGLRCSVTNLSMKHRVRQKISKRKILFLTENVFFD
jgi:hypothetical protein